MDRTGNFPIFASGALFLLGLGGVMFGTGNFKKILGVSVMNTACVFMLAALGYRTDGAHLPMASGMAAVAAALGTAVVAMLVRCAKCGNGQ